MRQEKDDEIANVMWHLKKTHRIVGSHCSKHPKGTANCRDCGSKKYIKTSIGEALRIFKKYLTD